MKLGLNLGYWGARPVDQVALAKAAERYGFDSVWTAEAYGSDAVAPLVWLAAQTERIHVGTAIMQISARTPAMTAMTATTIDVLTKGRFRLGLGASGPQVVEGWHGVSYARPLERTREYVNIVRRMIERQQPVIHQGRHFNLPYRGDDATGLGKPLKMVTHPLRADLPIYLAAIGPRNVQLAGEIADGWLPIFFSPEGFATSLRPDLLAGIERSGRPPGDFDIAPTVSVVVDEDVARARDLLRPGLALYIGGMGAPGANFYNDLATRYGYEEAASEVQRLYLAGRRREACAAIPDALIDEVALVGTQSQIAERLDAWRNAGVTTLICSLTTVEDIRLMAELSSR